MNIPLLLTVLAGLLLAIALLLFFFWRTQKTPGSLVQVDDAQNAENIRAYKQLTQDLKLRLDNNDITEQGYKASLSEAQKELLGVVSGQDAGSDSSVSTHPLSKLFAALFVVVGLLLAVWIYMPFGLSLGATQQQSIVEDMQALSNTNSRQAWMSSALQLHDKIDEYLPSKLGKRDDYQEMAALQAQLAMQLGLYDKAYKRYQVLVELNPDNLFLATNALEAEYLIRLKAQRNPLLTETMFDQLKSIIAVQPDSPVLLRLRGIGYFEQADYQAALQDWRRALALLPPNSNATTQLREGIEIAQQRLLQTDPTAKIKNNEPGNEAFIRVQVAIDPSLIKGDSPNTPVFVFARPVQGPKMPLAAKRLRLADLPMTLTLAESDTMAGGSLAKFDQVEVAARLSRSGAPVGASGDLESQPLVVTVFKAPASTGQSQQNFDAVDTLIINRVR